MTDRDSITRTRARAPGAEGDPPSMAVHRPVGGPAQYGATAPTLRCTKGDAKSKCDEGSEVLVRFLAAERNSLEALELTHKLLDAGAGAIERLREERRPVLGR